MEMEIEIVNGNGIVNEKGNGNKIVNGNGIVNENGNGNGNENCKWKW